jgi:hypothetical protein
MSFRLPAWTRSLQRTVAGANRCREISRRRIKGVVTNARPASTKSQENHEKAAVAQCNDGVYSYTKKNTCSKHGGIKVRYKK